MRLTALLVTGLLGIAACGGDGGGAAGGDQAAGGRFSVQLGSDPENLLIPGDTTEMEGNQLLKALFTPLVGYNVETSALEYTGVAESIESPDNKTWTVTLKQGWTFH